MFASSVGTEAAAVVRKMVNLSSPPRRCCSSKMVKGRTGQRVRLYVRGTILGYKRSRQIQVNTREDVAWYGGKRMACVYKAKTKQRHQLPLHLGKGLPLPCKHWRHPRQVHPR
ncbi:hypothetical protein VPH35_055928 [Triticum aestivum]|uniref:60S ribosomal protein L35a n=1 Tax=Triticum aestivum TaxID=4565 RepID=A0A077S0Z5_WHEAT|nr:unnamed protein product [Triticum aestivum]